MRKKMIVSLLLISLSLSLLTGCGGSTEPRGAEEGFSAEDVIEEDTEAKGSSASDGSSAPDNVVEATLENPAKIGEWAETKTYSPADKEDHTIYYRITGVIRGEEAQKAIDEYNAGDNFYEFTNLEDDDLEYCIITYETYFPPEFPQEDYGIVGSVELSFGVCNLGNAGAIGNYIGLSTRDISVEPDGFFPGNTFTEGRAVMSMLKGFDEYLIYPNYDYEHMTYTRGE